MKKKPIKIAPWFSMLVALTLLLPSMPAWAAKPSVAVIDMSRGKNRIKKRSMKVFNRALKKMGKVVRARKLKKSARRMKLRRPKVKDLARWRKAAKKARATHLIVLTRTGKKRSGEFKVELWDLEADSLVGSLNRDRPFVLKGKAAKALVKELKEMLSGGGAAEEVEDDTPESDDGVALIEFSAMRLDRRERRQLRKAIAAKTPIFPSKKLNKALKSSDLKPGSEPDVTPWLLAAETAGASHALFIMLSGEAGNRSLQVKLHHTSGREGWQTTITLSGPLQELTANLMADDLAQALESSRAIAASAAGDLPAEATPEESSTETEPPTAEPETETEPEAAESTVADSSSESAAMDSMVEEEGKGFAEGGDSVAADDWTAAPIEAEEKVSETPTRAKSDLGFPVLDLAVGGGVLVRRGTAEAGNGRLRFLGSPFMAASFELTANPLAAVGISPWVDGLGLDIHGVIGHVAIAGPNSMGIVSESQHTYADVEGSLAYRMPFSIDPRSRPSSIGLRVGGRVTFFDMASFYDWPSTLVTGLQLTLTTTFNLGSDRVAIHGDAFYVMPFSMGGNFEERFGASTSAHGFGANLRIQARMVGPLHIGVSGHILDYMARAEGDLSTGALLTDARYSDLVAGGMLELGVRF